MGWARLDDRWHDHPKTIEVGLDGAGLFAMCLTWANHTKATSKTPGVVPVEVVRRFAGPRANRLAARLTEAGFFDPRTVAGYPIHDFKEYLPKYDTEQARAAGAAGGKAKARGRGRSEPLAESPSEPLDDPGSEPPPEPNDEPLAEPQQTAKRSHVRADAGASARRNPVPVPEVRGETSEGGVTQVTRASRDAPPEPRCRRHLEHPAEGPCGPCGDARRARDAWDREQLQRQRDAGPVVGGHECVQHPGQPAGRCPQCASTAVPMPDDVREALRRKRSA